MWRSGKTCSVLAVIVFCFSISLAACREHSRGRSSNRHKHLHDRNLVGEQVWSSGGFEDGQRARGEIDDPEWLMRLALNLEEEASGEEGNLITDEEPNEDAELYNEEVDVEAYAAKQAFIKMVTDMRSLAECMGWQMNEVFRLQSPSLDRYTLDELMLILSDLEGGPESLTKILDSHRNKNHTDAGSDGPGLDNGRHGDVYRPLYDNEKAMKKKIAQQIESLEGSWQQRVRKQIEKSLEDAAEDYRIILDGETPERARYAVKQILSKAMSHVPIAGAITTTAHALAIASIFSPLGVGTAPVVVISMYGGQLVSYVVDKVTGEVINESVDSSWEYLCLHLKGLKNAALARADIKPKNDQSGWFSLRRWWRGGDSEAGDGTGRKQTQPWQENALDMAQHPLEGRVDRL